MNYYCYELYEENNTFIGKTKPFDVQDIHSTWVREETEYIKSKAKKPSTVSVLLVRVLR